MTDREKVIKALECCANPEARCSMKECPYFEVHNYCWVKLEQDALELLKKPDCEHAEHDSAGCLGYAGCEQDDEPIEICKKCDAYTLNKSGRQ